MSSKTRDWACFYGVYTYVPIQRMIAVTVTVYLSSKTWRKALENYQHRDNSVPFISMNGERLYEFVCFPTVSLCCNLPEIEHNMPMYQHAKKQKELARQTCFDPIFGSKLAQKIVMCGFVIRCFPSQPSKIDADVLYFVLWSLSICSWLPSAWDKETMLEQGKIKPLWDGWIRLKGLNAVRS